MGSNQLDWLDKDWKEYKAAKDWLKNLESHNLKKCRTQFPRFLRYLKEEEGLELNPDQIIELRRKDLMSNDRHQRRRWEHICKRFYHKEYNEREKQGRSTKTAMHYMGTVRSFFKHNDYPLSYDRGELKKPYTVRKAYELSNVEARVIYDSLESWRDKAMFLLAYQNGFLAVDIARLNIEDLPIEKLREKKVKPPIYFETVRHKTKAKLQTAFGEDLCYCVLKMLELEPRESGPLFISQKGNRMSSKYIIDSIMPIAKKLISDKLQFKDFRDAFHDACNNAGLNQRQLDALMGHVPAGARGNYLVSKKTIIKAYEKVYPLLTINQYTRAREEEAELRRTVETLKQTVETQSRTIQAFIDRERRTRENLKVKLGLADTEIDDLIGLMIDRYMSLETKIFDITEELTHLKKDIEEIHRDYKELIRRR